MSLSILIGEDNFFTSKQYQRILEKNGHKVTLTHDGDECLKKFFEQKKNNDLMTQSNGIFDIVLVDNNMPKKSGVQVAEEILNKSPNQRIIFASAYDIGSLLNASEKIKKSVEILKKPFSLNILLSKIQNKK